MLLKHSKFVIECNGQIFFSGSERECLIFAKKRIKLFPNHQPLYLLKFIKEMGEEMNGV